MVEAAAIAGVQEVLPDADCRTAGAEQPEEEAVVEQHAEVVRPGLGDAHEAAEVRGPVVLVGVGEGVVEERHQGRRTPEHRVGVVVEPVAEVDRRHDAAPLVDDRRQTVELGVLGLLGGAEVGLSPQPGAPAEVGDRRSVAVAARRLVPQHAAAAPVAVDLDEGGAGAAAGGDVVVVQRRERDRYGLHRRDEHGGERQRKHQRLRRLDGGGNCMTNPRGAGEAECDELSRACGACPPPRPDARAGQTVQQLAAGARGCGAAAVAACRGRPKATATVAPCATALL